MLSQTVENSSLSPAMHEASSTDSSLPNGRKEKRNPSVTPRKFKKFFTPRPNGSQSVTTSRRALNDITAPANNRDIVQSSPLRPRTSDSQENQDPILFRRDTKRRKLVHTPEASPDRSFLSKKSGVGIGSTGKDRSSVQSLESSPCERIGRSATHLEVLSEIEEADLEGVAEEDEEDDDDDELLLPPRPVKRIVPLSNRGLSGRLLQLSIGNSIRQHHQFPVNDWQDETASFYSRPSDIHTCTSIENGNLSIPFCAAGCNTNTLTAIGDEEGRVRLLESGQNGKPSFKDSYLSFRVHTNAIIDMCFSNDDTLLATASGDSTARVVDMTTQSTIGIFSNHFASLKQVRFQPGANNRSVLATSSRDGSVQIWDLRCKGRDGPVNELSIPIEPHRTLIRSASQEVLFGLPVNSIHDAHRPIGGLTQNTSIGSDTSRGELPRRAGDVSVTAIEFLPFRENLILTASEADASVKLWDIRALQSKRKTPTALSATAKPHSHIFRDYGITSMNLSTDSSRLYTVCKDNTVYAYSTAHLMLGSAPELASASEGRRASSRPIQEALGPLYGFRHPKLHVSSFYIKSAIRRTKDDKSEVLAVGSSDRAAVLFPTDERYLPKSDYYVSQNDCLGLRSFGSSQNIAPSRRGVGAPRGGKSVDSVPISQCGTALISGHDKEVGSVTWTSDGELVTVGDDFLVRVWREGDDARDLRTGGQSEGRRWGCGWAEVSTDYDDDD